MSARGWRWQGLLKTFPSSPASQRLCFVWICCWGDWKFSRLLCFSPRPSGGKATCNNAEPSICKKRATHILVYEVAFLICYYWKWKGLGNLFPEWNPQVEFISTEENCAFRGLPMERISLFFCFNKSKTCFRLIYITEKAVRSGCFSCKGEGILL